MRDPIATARSGRPCQRRYAVMIQLIVAFAAFYCGVANAQRANPLELRLGIGTFLSHDRGWNYSEPIEFFAALTRRTGPVDVEGGVSFSKSFAQFSRPAVNPPLPTAYRDGFRSRLGLRIPATAQSLVSALVGTELIVNRTEGEARAATFGGVLGVGLNFGPARRAALDLRYVRFAKRLGSSRGILPLTISWRL